MPDTQDMRNLHGVEEEERQEETADETTSSKWEKKRESERVVSSQAIQQADMTPRITQDGEAVPYTSLNPPKGWKPTDRYLAARMDGYAKRKAYQEGIIDIGGQTYDSELGRSFLEQRDWDWENPPLDENGEPLGPEGQPLPKRAKGWRPDGKPYYGRGLGGSFRKIADTFQSSVARDIPGTPEYEEYQEKLKTADNLWEKSKVRVGNATMFDMAKIMWVGALGILDLSEQVPERLGTTGSMTVEDLANATQLPALPSKPTDNLPKFVQDFASFAERASPIRNFYNSKRAVYSSGIRLLKGEGAKKVLFDDLIEHLSSNWTASIMGWSIGANQESYKQEFLTRVDEGGDPGLVALDMEKPFAQFAGHATIDLMWFVQTIRKGAKLTGKLADISDDTLNRVDEVAEVIGKHGEEPISALRGADNIDEVVRALDDAFARIKVGDKTFGLAKATGNARRSKAATEAGLFGQWVAGVAKNPDDATEIFENMARLASDDIDEKKNAIAFLVGALDNPEPIFSEGGIKFSQIMRSAFTDDDGVLQFGKFADDFLKLQNTGDAQKIWEFIGTKMDDAIKDAFPTVKEAIEAGEDVPFVMRMLARAEDTLPGKTKRAVNWFSGRAYIGTNPGVAIRGGLHDLFLSVTDTDMSILSKSPGKWAEYSVKWLGTEHPALTKGFSKADIQGLESIILDETGYKNIPSYLEALKGGEDVKALDKLSLPFARLLQRMEISSSQRITGKAVQDAMEHILRHDKALPAVDDLVKAGLPQEVAENLTDRIMANYGDVDKVRKTIFRMIDEGAIQEFGHGAWLDDASRKTLQEFGVYDDFLQSIKAGESPSEMIEEVMKLKDELLSKVDDLSKQHAQAIVNEIQNPNGVAQVNKALYEAVDSPGGAPLQKILDEINDVFSIDRTVNSAWGSAADDVIGKVDNYIRSTGDDELITRWNELRPRLNKRVGQSFAQFTGVNKRRTDKIAEFSKKIRGASDEDMPAIIKQAEDFFDIELSKTKKAANQLWEVIWQDRQSLGFRQARRASQDEFANVVDDLKTILPEDVVDDIVGKSKWHERAGLMERLATQFDDSVMINGELKPLGEYTRALLASGDNKNAIRLLARYTRAEPIAKPGATLFDQKIVGILRNGGMDITDLNDADPFEAFEILQDWRVAHQFSRQADTLEDLLGHRPDVILPEAASEVYRILDSFKKAGGLSTDEIKTLFKFINNNGAGDDIVAMKDISKRATQEISGDEQLLDELVDLAQNVQRNLLDEIAEGTGKISNAPATAEIKHLLKKAGVEFSDDITQRKAWKMLYESIEGDPEDIVRSLVPPFDGGEPTEVRHIYESRQFIENAFDNVIEGIRKNFGKTSYVETDQIGDDLFKALNDWFDTASGRVDDARLMSSKYAQGVRDFALHDYTQRYGFDTALSYLFNFHFWPSRTAYKWMTKRIWNNPGLVSAYFDYREYMGKIHADAPDWWKYAINTNELLGLNMDNPLFFRLENTFQPIYLTASTDFTDSRKRVNWWSTMIDDIGKYTPGYWNPLIQYGLATALRVKEEEEAAARWAGRALPATRLVKSITALLGVKGGKGLELDPSTKYFSGDLGPYEKKRVAKTLAQFVKDGRYTEEQIIDAARTRSGPAWEEAMAAQQKKYAVGNILSQFSGINTRQRTMEDLEVDNFWKDYSLLWGMSADMTDEEFRYNMEAMRQKYPFMDALLLGRKGDKQRDRAYAYAVLSRIAPGKTDNVSKALGLDYDYIGKFYESKGDWSDWTEGEKKTFMGAVVDLGASLAIPDNAVKREWAEASVRYSQMYDEAEERFGEDIWTKIDVAYAQKQVGVNSRETFQRYLDENPDVERAMEWRTKYILNDPVLSAYYGGLDKLRSYYEGKMYHRIGQELGQDIWDKWNVLYSYENTGQNEKASAYRKQHPELKKYSELKKKGLEEIQELILEFGDKLPEGEPTRLREDVGESIGAQQAQEYVERPEEVGYTIQEWTSMLGPELTRLAILSYEGEQLPTDIRNLLDQQAEMFGLTRQELIENIGQSSRR